MERLVSWTPFLWEIPERIPQILLLPVHHRGRDADAHHDDPDPERILILLIISISKDLIIRDGCQPQKEDLFQQEGHLSLGTGWT
ncbi:hypothetical protein CEXT_153881 [Caerostris extrusa]|uniref:Uncharacterized protein n=1 Tax=Caerostris extrusa TaxID=172846 RepID=A0AAV4W7J9_CAEEX|nr:hypothetical protein CEXT_153881 [Caerostris extrusa]